MLNKYAKLGYFSCISSMKKIFSSSNVRIDLVEKRVLLIISISSKVFPKSEKVLLVREFSARSRVSWKMSRKDFMQNLFSMKGLNLIYKISKQNDIKREQVKI